MRYDEQRLMYRAEVPVPTIPFSTQEYLSPDETERLAESFEQLAKAYRNAGRLASRQARTLKQMGYSEATSITVRRDTAAPWRALKVVVTAWKDEESA